MSDTEKTTADLAVGIGADELAQSRADFVQSVKVFAGQNGEYYAQEFDKIQHARGLAFSWNSMAALLGPIWAGARGLWGYFWGLVLVETLAIVLMGRGLWGELGARFLEQAEKRNANAARMLERAEDALTKGDTAGAEGLTRTAENLKRAADKALAQADAANADASMTLLAGLALFAVIKIFEGFRGNPIYEAHYTRWRSDKTVVSGVTQPNIILGVFLVLAILPITIYRFTVSKVSDTLNPLVSGFPDDSKFMGGMSPKDAYNATASYLEEKFDALALAGGDFSDGITSGIRTILDALETVLVGTPWPVVMLVIVVLAWRIAGSRVAIFTIAALAYLALLGFWEKSMETVALLGAAAFICIVIGIPLGVWFGKSERAYAIARPVLDFMQTMPSFVYLIPVIAFFGTGKPPGILATIVFGMPPVVRLTALGMRQVPHSIKEGALAFGANRWQLLRNVEIPLAMPAIMTGINQTILMCLSMVVIAALIGAGGLGQDVLVALQYAAKGQGLLAGLAILFCAMVIDRIVQGTHKRTDES